MIKVFVVYWTLSSLFANVFGSPIELGDSRLACATGVHVIVARGSNESPGQGTLSSVSQTILSRVAGSDAIGVDYPATLTNYDQSKAQGVAALTSMIQSYVASCPNARIVLMGYSQGAHVMGDTLCGSDSNSPLPSRYSANIAAVIQTGDPSHTVGLSFNTGTSTRNGIFPRSSTASCSTYASDWKSYCDTGDPFCDSGSNLNVHYGYTTKYGNAAASFVVLRL